jgi:transcriptional regulator with XRE-family HTH domain
MELSILSITLLKKYSYISKMEVVNLGIMEEEKLRAVLAENIKKYRGRRGWNQLFLAEKIGISANYLSAVETGKGWVTPQTLVKLANALDIEVFELFMPVVPAKSAKTDREFEKIKRFAKDLTLVLEASTAEAAKTIKKNVAKVCKEYMS